MYKPVFYIVFLFWFFKSNAQENLVPNGSFEEYKVCPSGTGNILSLNNWYSANNATPDYYNSCDLSNGSGVPDNDWGYQFAQDGKGYLGLAVYGSNLTTQAYREYAQVKLRQTLIQGQYYYWSGYLSLLDETDLACNNFGIAFSNDSIKDIASESILPLNPAMSYQEIVLNKDGWVKMDFIYLANGDEKFMTLGNFHQNDDTDFINIDSNAIGGPFAYYYVDNVSLTPYEIHLPNVFSPNDDGVNDFLFTPMFTEGTSLTILNRWGQKIFFTSKPSEEYWDGSANGELCQEGTYFYFIVKKNTKKTGFIQLIR